LQSDSAFGSGVFYVALAILGLLLGNPSMNGAWDLGPMLLHTGDHIFHLVLGSLFHRGDLSLVGSGDLAMPGAPEIG
jgi:hypothetical protein